MSAPSRGRTTEAPLWLGWGALGVIGAAAAVSGQHVATVAVAVLPLIGLVYWHRVLLSFEAMIIAVIAVIFLVPIKRYTLPGNLPFELEPYRVLVALIVGAWFVALLVDDRVRLRRTPLDAPILAIVVTILASVAANGRYISSLGVSTEVVKSLTFFASFFLLYALCTSVLLTRRSIDLVVKTIVVAGSLVGLATMYEYRTGNNVFNHLGQMFPVLRAVPLTALGLDPDTLARSGRLRVYSSAQHPIALAAVLIMLVPLAFYLWKRSGNRIWLAAGGAISLGALGTISRTGVVMAIVVVIVFLVLRFHDSVRLIPYAVPALVVVFFALPNALGSFYGAFFPKNGLLAEQSAVVANNDIGATGRLGDIGPWWAQYRKRPLIGQGFGSRITFRTNDPAAAGAARNARLLDDQWLGTMLEVGILGTLALIWLFVRTYRRLKAVARSDPGPTGWLAVALAASLMSFAIGMFTYDTFGFVQVTMVAFLLFGIAAAYVRLEEESSASPATPELR